ncbi:MAG: arylamine N-acetyltransferase [Chloroflexi bacterium]|nr:arylamine N-acetyltransferase [Chloroflexota bacterium]
MTEIEPLPPSLCRRILSHFDMSVCPPPTLETLQELVTKYTRIVPWESASRIARRARQAESADCAHLGQAFWESHFARGAGGTCYESNYAFFGLLRWLGYDGYLTINDMGEYVGCHSAIIVLLDNQKFLVDVGLPLYAILPLREGLESTAESHFMRYTAKPLAEGRFEIWRSVPRYERVFQLNDKPVGEAEYRAVTLHDYRHDGGQFLNEVVIRKVLNDQLWRFNSGEQPFVLQQFVDGERRDHALGEDAAAELAAKFGIARAVLAEAMTALGLDGR